MRVNRLWSMHTPLTLGGLAVMAVIGMFVTWGS
jgi:hypothetical protein